MPTVGIIDGIKIDCYTIEHLPPHIHAKYNEYEALIEIETRKLYAGYLPTKQFKKAINYVKHNEGMLLETYYKFNENLRPNEKNT